MSEIICFLMCQKKIVCSSRCQTKCFLSFCRHFCENIHFPRKRIAHPTHYPHPRSNCPVLRGEQEEFIVKSGGRLSKIPPWTNSWYCKMPYRTTTRSGNLKLNSLNPKYLTLDGHSKINETPCTSSIVRNQLLV